jgi:hypothetical protein
VGALVALPVLATIWTRSSSVVKVSRSARTPLPNVAYSTREWNIAITSFEVQEWMASGDVISPRWIFYYKNTDAEAHYVAITVQCQDAQRRDRTRFGYTATLQPNVKDEASIEIVSKLKSQDWRSTIFARVTVDFLSSPSG